MPIDGESHPTRAPDQSAGVVADALDIGLARLLAASARLHVVARPDGRTVLARGTGRMSPAARADGDAAASPASSADGSKGASPSEHASRTDDARTDDAAVTEHPLGIDVRLVPAGPSRVHVDVELGGWVTRVSRSPLPVGAGAAAVDDANDEELLEVVGLALDLVGAACFGEVRVHQIHRAGRLSRSTVELAAGDGWSTIGEVRRLVWPFGPRIHTVLRNQEPRPDDCAAIGGPPLPWAPWAGRAGFVGRAEASAEVVDLGRGGVLDLHGMEPRRVAKVVDEFVETSQREGVLALRIIHGKGKGVFRDLVHQRLRGHPAVRSFRIAGHGAGGWGATLVDLRPAESATPGGMEPSRPSGDVDDGGSKQG